LQAIILDYFAVFIEPQLDSDLAAMCKHLCAGISIDETFKVAGMCSVWEGDDRRKKRYVQTTYAVQTAHSSVTQMMCGIEMMPSKTAESKQRLVEAILRQQTGEGTTRTVYVATDCPDVDMLLEHAAAAGLAAVWPAAHNRSWGRLMACTRSHFAAHQCSSAERAPCRAPGPQGSISYDLQCQGQ
jgi:hypothetical protein